MIDSKSKEDALHQQYHNIKQWRDASFGRILPHHFAYFTSELKRTRVGTIKKAIEIGFGAGSFLKYCVLQNIQCLGVELNIHQVHLARAKGYDVIMDDELDELILKNPQVDLVVMFDVLEHIPREQLVEALCRYATLLRPGGCILVRVPNGDSPFGLFNQNGDLTHCTTIGSQMVLQLSVLTDMELDFVGGEAQPIICGSLLWMLHRAVQWPFRLLLDFVVRWCFFPKSKMSFTSTNLTFILRKKESLEI
jgi:SAM-dependent methyltransferase